jgi:hypothetical protein
LKKLGLDAPGVTFVMVPLNKFGLYVGPKPKAVTQLKTTTK